MQCLLCGKKVSRLRHWKSKSEFCSEEHAEAHKRQTLDRLMQSQEELLSRAALPLPDLEDDSGPAAPDFEPRISEAPAAQTTSFATNDTKPRIDRSHQLPAAQPETLRAQAIPLPPPDQGISESLEEPRIPQQADQEPVGALHDPLQRLMEATASKPIADEPYSAGLASREARDEEPLGEATGEPMSEASSERDAVLQRLMGEGDPHLTPSDPVGARHQDEEALVESAEVPPARSEPEDWKVPGPEAPQPVDLAPLESVEVDLNDSLRSRMEGTTAKPVFPESEVTAPAEPSGNHDAIVARLMGATADERPALSDLLEGDLLEGVDEATADEAEFADALEQAAVRKPAEIISQPSAPGLNLSLQELLDGLDASEPPEAREDRVGINELGEGTPAFSDGLMPATAPAERAWDDIGDRSRRSAELLEAWGRHEPATPTYAVEPARTGTLNIVDCRKARGIVTADRAGSLSIRGAQWMVGEPSFTEMAEAAVERMEGLLAIGAGGATAPSLVLSVPSFDPRPAGRHTGPGGLTSLLNATPNFIEVREAADGSWHPEDFSSSPSTPSGAVALGDFGIIAAGSTSAAYALHIADWASSRSGAATLGLADVCEVAPIEVREGLIGPWAGCRVPGFRLDPIPSEDQHQRIRLFGLLSGVSPEAAQGEPLVPPRSEDMIAASWECRTPQARIEGLAGENQYRGIVPAEMVRWVNPSTMGQQGLPVFANWTGGVEQPRQDIEVPVVLLTGAIRSVRQFPQLGYLLKSTAGEALMRGLQSGDTSGILPVPALNEQANQSQLFSVMQLELRETNLEAIGPAAAVYAPADLDPLEYA